MTSITYNLGIPNPVNAPATDVPNMQINTNNIASYIAVDHVPFNSNLAGTANGGWHRIIHLPVVAKPGAQASPPAGQLYAKTASGDTQLFYESSGGVETQLTGTGGAAFTSASGTFAITTSFQTLFTLPANCTGFLYIVPASTAFGLWIIDFLSVSGVGNRQDIKVPTNVTPLFTSSMVGLDLRVQAAVAQTITYKYIFWTV